MSRNTGLLWQYIFSCTLGKWRDRGDSKLRLTKSHKTRRTGLAFSLFSCILALLCFYYVFCAS